MYSVPANCAARAHKGEYGFVCIIADFAEKTKQKENFYEKRQSGLRFICLKTINLN